MCLVEGPERDNFVDCLIKEIRYKGIATKAGGRGSADED